MQVRRLTDRGVEEFKDYLQEIKDSEEFNPPDLNRKTYSEPLEGDVRIDPEKNFEDKMEMAKYLASVFENSEYDRDELVIQNKMWSWFAYIWLRQFVEKEENGFSVYANKAYICSNNWNRYYRHQISPAYFIYSKHKEKSKIFLDSPVYERNEFIGQLAARKSIISSESVIETAHTLYWDEQESKIKRGARSRNKPGTARRLGLVVKQLEQIYDLHGMSSEEILGILPSNEFNRWQETEEEGSQTDESDSSTEDSTTSLRDRIGI